MSGAVVITAGSLSGKNPPDLTVVGWRIWYADGSIVDSAKTSWASAPATGIQAVVFYHRGQYKIWIDMVWKVFNYRRVLVGVDYYWCSPDLFIFGGGASKEVPGGLLAGDVKTGTLIATDAFLTIQNAVYAADSDAVQVAP